MFLEGISDFGIRVGCLLRGWWGWCCGPDGLCSWSLGGPGSAHSQEGLRGLRVSWAAFAGYSSFGDDSLFWRSCFYSEEGQKCRFRGRSWPQLCPCALPSRLPGQSLLTRSLCWDKKGKIVKSKQAIILCVLVFVCLYVNKQKTVLQLFPAVQWTFHLNTVN